MITIRRECTADIAAREALLDEAFGEERFRKSSERLREGQLPAAGLSFVATENRRLIGTARMWTIEIGNRANALLLGPVAVACDEPPSASVTPESGCPPASRTRPEKPCVSSVAVKSAVRSAPHLKRHAPNHVSGCATSKPARSPARAFCPPSANFSVKPGCNWRIA